MAGTASNECGSMMPHRQTLCDALVRLTQDRQGLKKTGKRAGNNVRMLVGRVRQGGGACLGSTEVRAGNWEGGVRINAVGCTASVRPFMWRASEPSRRRGIEFGRL